MSELWIIVALFAYFLAALNSVIDKYLLKRSIPNPIVYSFYVGIFSAFSIILTPFGLEWPGLEQFVMALAVGVVFLVALVAFFTALKKDEASRTVSIVGGFTPVFILILSGLLLGEALNQSEFYAFIFLVLGGIIISMRKSKKKIHAYYYGGSVTMALLAAIFFAFFFVLAKFVFTYQPFISGFVWTRMGSFFAALLLLLIPYNRDLIFNTTRRVSRRTGELFVANKALAGVSFFALNYAIFLGSVTLVNALEGIKYVFLLLIVYILSKRYPHILREKTSFLTMLQKISAIMLIVIGLFLLASNAL